MRYPPSTLAALVFLCCGALLTHSIAWAGPKEDVAAATVTWGETLAQK